MEGRLSRLVIWGLWPQRFRASVFNFGAEPPHGSRLDTAASPFSSSLYFFRGSLSSLNSVYLFYPLFSLPLSVTLSWVPFFFHSSHGVSSASFRLLSLPLITQAAIEPKRPLSTTLTEFSKTRPLRGRSPLGPAIQTDLLCWGVISTGWPPLHSFPASLGPPTAGDWCQQGILSHVSFNLLQTYPDPEKHL